MQESSPPRRPPNSTRFRRMQLTDVIILFDRPTNRTHSLVLSVNPPAPPHSPPLSSSGMLPAGVSIQERERERVCDQVLPLFGHILGQSLFQLGRYQIKKISKFTHIWEESLINMRCWLSAPQLCGGPANLGVISSVMMIRKSSFCHARFPTDVIKGENEKGRELSTNSVDLHAKQQHCGFSWGFFCAGKFSLIAVYATSSTLLQKKKKLRELWV